MYWEGSSAHYFQLMKSEQSSVTATSVIKVIIRKLVYFFDLLILFFLSFPLDSWKVKLGQGIGREWILFDYLAG